MITNARKFFSFIFVVCICYPRPASAQIVISPTANAQMLAQQLVGGGVSISNVTFTGARGAAGFFNITSATPPLGLDSGIVLSTGYVQTNYLNNNIGINNTANDHNGITRASTNLNRPGDANLATIIPQNYDAAVLEFDFVPTGDSIVFRYVFGSEEYPQYNCTQYNDVFAFFISGPGITGSKNIALVPGTNIPVAINSINNGTVDPSGGPGANLGNCINMGPGSPFTQYYINNSTGQYIAYNGFTSVLEAASRVQPCQVYHLKIAIADGVDRVYDSGVFLEAKSLRSEGLTIQNGNPVSTTGQPYLVEGCNTGGIRIVRRTVSNLPQQVSLFYGGTAVNGLDVNMLPNSITIPANDSFIYMPIIPVADHLAEGIEKFKIYIANSCSNGVSAFADSIEIEIRDYDTLGIIPKDSTGICRSSPLQLTASAGYNTYTWQPASLLSNASIRNPVVSSAIDTTFICTATLGNCVARDSVKLKIKKLALLSKQDVVCKNFASGQIMLQAGWQWQQPLQFWVNNGLPQADSTFLNLAAGTYIVKLKDATGCTDSLTVAITQLFPDLNIDTTIVTPALCTDSTAGFIKVIASGGNPAYAFSVDGATYQPANILPATVGIHSVTVRDQNNCTDTTHFQINFNNTVLVNAGNDTAICEGTMAQLHATSSVPDITWAPTNNITIPAIINPAVSPVVPTYYIITAKDANCIKKDTVFINVYPAPLAKAGNDTAVCTGGAVQLSGRGGISFRWSPATFLDNAISANPVARPLSSITYSLMVTDQHNCSSLQPDLVFIRTVPSVIAFAGNDTIAAIGQPLQLNGRQLRDTSARQYIWSPAIGLNNPNIANPVSTLSSNQTYRLTLRTPQGCEGYDDIMIKVYNGPEIYVASGFTPNGDGRNDVLRAIAVGIKSLTYFNIYNRWGQMIFHTTISEKGWDGKINGLVQLNQSFVWMAEGIGYNDTLIQRRGSVVVIE